MPGKQIQVLSGHLQWVYCCSVSPDCSMLCSAAGEKSVSLKRWVPFSLLPEFCETWRSEWASRERESRPSASRFMCKPAPTEGMLVGRDLLLHTSLLIRTLTQTRREEMLEVGGCSHHWMRAVCLHKMVKVCFLNFFPLPRLLRI